ncbi:MAG TPA: SDR family NAD(P)-dependent oxidoreductase [Mycobacteriales bacterium]|nr:SDR family NAD(P)-dependent oxidoreductase [Mycobacteriales bacterium]
MASDPGRATMGLLDGRVAIVTGAGRGLGRAHALTLAQAGAAVVVNDYGAGVGGEPDGESPAASVVDEICAAGGVAVADASSVADWAACGRLVELAVDKFGRLDAVVNNAGIARDHMMTSSTEQDFDATIAVHLKGTFAMCHHASRYWRDLAKSGEVVSGRLVNTTSGAAMFGNIGQTAYASAKAGIIAITQTLAMEMQRYAVTVNAISPVALTRMTKDLMTSVPDGGFDPLDPANASGLVAYLASAESGWLTGQVFRIEGNRIVRMREWSPVADYASRSGAAVTADELVTGMAHLYGVAPRGVTTVSR